ncbi:hypothetical protein THAOC_15203 [Thalassiosira oceanica]|uniref:Uncharacterized protein n=1 Tax=Thalassiosira oceanica TaxID=159749 RepID=K0SFF3_THAOC|nr:hypothetical protein THAOC_15203 [Thalassiosira oceanica]|eukprot:EJK64095.1 hypothetical protein THAOC_15203 [Thalassiosira oceanica]
MRLAPSDQRPGVLQDHRPFYDDPPPRIGSGSFLASKQPAPFTNPFRRISRPQATLHQRVHSRPGRPTSALRRDRGGREARSTSGSDHTRHGGQPRPPCHRALLRIRYAIVITSTAELDTFAPASTGRKDAAVCRSLGYRDSSNPAPGPRRPRHSPKPHARVHARSPPQTQTDSRGARRAGPARKPKVLRGREKSQKREEESPPNQIIGTFAALISCPPALTTADRSRTLGLDQSHCGECVQRGEIGSVFSPDKVERPPPRNTFSVRGTPPHLDDSGRGLKGGGPTVQTQRKESSRRATSRARATHDLVFRDKEQTRREKGRTEPGEEEGASRKYISAARRTTTRDGKRHGEVSPGAREPRGVSSKSQLRARLSFEPRRRSLREVNTVPFESVGCPSTRVPVGRIVGEATGPGRINSTGGV